MRIHRTIGSAAMMVALLCSGTAMAISDTARQQGIPTLAPMLEDVTPAVVSIRVLKSAPAMQRFWFGEDQIPDELRRWIPDLPESPENQPRNFTRGAGSGVIIDAENGYVVTNHHVVGDADEISVQLSDGRTLSGELLGSDPSTDIALLQIDAQGLTDIGLAAIDTVQVGDYVVAIGNPFGIGQTVTSGIVSALGRAGLNNENYEDFIQTDAAINMGNSGGALVDLEGNLVGINTAIISASAGSNGVGFAVPVDMMGTVVEHLLRDGEVRRGMLGVSIVDVTPQVAESLDLNTSTGALVTSVVPDSAAERAGIEVSDVIVELDGEAVSGSRDLRNMVGLRRRGQTVNVRLYRNGESRSLTAVIGGDSGSALADSGQPAQRSEFRGATLRSLSADEAEWVDSGVLVTDVAERSPAALSGLRAGDIIIEVNRSAVSDLSEFSERIAASERLTALTILRDGRRLLLLMS